MTLTTIKQLDKYNDPAEAHQGLDEMLKARVGTAASSFVIVYEPGQVPEMRYYGRTLTRTELRGVLMTLLLEVGSG